MQQGQGAVSNHPQVEQGQGEPDHNERSIDRSVVKGRSIGRQRTSDQSGDRGLHFRDSTSTAPPAQYLAQRAQQAQPTPVPPPTTTVTTPVATAKPTSRPKKRAKLPVLTLPRPTLQRVDFHKSTFTDLGIQIVKGKAMAKVSTSPYVPPPESLLFLEEDMIPNLDIGAMPKNRVDDLYKETSCPYWDPKIKGHLFARLDVKTHQPISRAGRVLLNKAERDAIVALKLQVKNQVANCSLQGPRLGQMAGLETSCQGQRTDVGTILTISQHTYSHSNPNSLTWALYTSHLLHPRPLVLPLRGQHKRTLKYRRRRIQEFFDVEER